MAQSQSPRESVTLAIRRPSDDPAVFLAGSFSDPKWEPLELSVKPIDVQDDEGLTSTEYLFSREIEVPAGQYQYRFREGASGPWFHDESVKSGTSSPFSIRISPQIFPG